MRADRMISSAFRGILTRFGYRHRKATTRLTQLGHAPNPLHTEFEPHSGTNGLLNGSHI